MQVIPPLLSHRAIVQDRLLLRLGIVGTVILALCCFTPILVVLMGVVGLSALTGYLDIVLLPALAFFIALSVYSVWRRQRRAQTTHTDGDR